MEHEAHKNRKCRINTDPQIDRLITNNLLYL